MAEALARLAARPTLVSAVGADRQGRSILAGCPALHTGLVRVHPTAPTATYTAVIDRRENFPLKGLSHEMDLAFDDMKVVSIGYFGVSCSI